MVPLRVKWKKMLKSLLNAARLVSRPTVSFGFLRIYCQKKQNVTFLMSHMDHIKPVWSLMWFLMSSDFCDELKRSFGMRFIKSFPHHSTFPAFFCHFYSKVPDSTSGFLRCVGLPSTDTGRDHMRRLKDMLEAAMDVYTFMVRMRASGMSFSGVTLRKEHKFQPNQFVG